MKSILLTFLLVLALGGGVRELTADNFDHIITSAEWVLVHFRTSWCGDCWEVDKAFRALAPELLHVKLGRIDGDEEDWIARQNDVTDYPTLKLYHNGAPAEQLTGIQTADSIRAFVAEMTNQ
eukprot:NODE_7045_length_472_cov_13.979710_g6879_i0.p1 GENE.NODE_7045_length_472_cov_13.979710_g6879_i0~~NODE_7045_length_472_cov_13.979710_g6879_i0.p1  ORF type:complete len:139 (-),score=38.50 NODE_7045_length_472_cov_13.979710_g6879_i0:56-421(-)